MDRIYDKCCGIDVHKKLIVACFRKGNRKDVREFGATTRELPILADWLKDGGCEMIAMESTASYWKPLYNILESSGLKAMVVNAHHMKAVPSRKTDVKNIHIKNLDDETDHFMKPEEKKASAVIQDVTGIGNTSAQAIISVIGTDMERFLTDSHISSWARAVSWRQ